MANTIMTAKNTFAEGLIMDFAPDNTQATCLTSALNATLLTFNGNEMSLLNDMGNGRVETAFLPEGYIPVGTCEFGDIIYIVSYNPLINKSLIGCFPSPERNISSLEVGELKQSLRWTDFLNGDDKPNGSLKTTSVKKILYDSKSMNPGDKYIIYSLDVVNNSKTLSDYNNLSETHNTFPKLVKIHVVAIEDSGKINYLDSSVKWYENNYYISDKKIGTDQIDIDEYRNLVSSNYSIFQSKVSGKLAILVELERITTFDHSYSIRTNDKDNNRDFIVDLNVSWDTINKNINPSGVVITKSSWRNIKDGKIEYTTRKDGENVVELIKVPSFDSTNNTYYGILLGRTYKPEIENDYKYFIENLLYDEVIKKYSDYTNIILSELNNITETVNGNLYFINPKYINRSYKSINSDGVIGEPIIELISDDIVNNYFHKEVTRELLILPDIPYKIEDLNKTYYNDLTNFIWDYELAPVMPYGILEDLKMSGSINFGNVNSDIIDLSEWKYYNDGNISTLKWGLEAYPNGKKITKVVFEFYDNLGVVGTYIIKDKVSFSGSFTETILFGADGVNPKLTPYDIDGNLILHAGDGPYAFLGDKDEFLDIIGTNYISKNITEGDLETSYFYKNDAGILYSNLVYLVKIYVFTASVDHAGNIIRETYRDPFIRFYWTNNMLNSYYYNYINYVGIEPVLTYSLDVSFKSNNNFLQPRPENNPNKYIINNQSKAPDIENPTAELVASTTLGGMILEVLTTGIGNNRENLYMSIVPCLDDSYNTFTFDFEKLQDVKYNIYLADLSIHYSDAELIYSDSYVGNIKAMERGSLQTDPHLQDNFKIECTLDSSPNGSVDYITTSGESKNYTGIYYETDAKLAMSYESSKGVPLVLTGLMVSKIAGTVYSEKNINAVLYKPVIGIDSNGSINVDDLIKYGIIKTDSTMYFLNCFVTGMSGDQKYKCNFGIVDCSGTYGDYFIPDDNSRTTYDGGVILNMDLGTMLKNANLETSPYSLLTFAMFDSKIDEAMDPGSDKDLDGHVMLKTTAGNNSSVAYTWRQNWRKESLTDRDFVLRFPFGKGERYPDGGYMLWDLSHSLKPYRTLSGFVARTVSGKYVLFNNFFSSYPAAETNVNLRFAYTNYCGGIQTMAQMLVALLSKIYYKSNETLNVSVNTVSNIVTWSDYITTWKKNIITDVKYNEEGKHLLVMLGLSYEDYINDLLKNLTIPEGFDNNIKLNINMNKTHTTEFLYLLKYDIEYLQKMYNSSEITYYIAPDITGDISGYPVIEPPFYGTLGIWDYYSKAFVSPTNINKVPSLSNSLKNNSDVNKAIKLSSKILNNLTIKDDILMLRDITTSYNARIEMTSGNYGDSKGRCWFKLDSNNCFFDDSIFKIK